MRARLADRSMAVELAARDGRWRRVEAEGGVRLKRLRKLVLSHVSQQNNRPDLALAAVREHLRGWPGDLIVASQDEGMAWVELQS